MKAVLKFAFFLSFIIEVKAQLTTFSLTIKDTLNLYNYTSRAIEFPTGVYTLVGEGNGLSFSQGGYQQIYQIDEQGNLLQKKINYDTTRRYFGDSKIIKTIDDNFLVSSTRTRLGGSGGNKIFVSKISPDLNDTLWTYLHSDSSYFDTTADLFEADNGDVYVSARRRPFENDSMLGVLICLNSVGQFVFEKTLRERKFQAHESIVQLPDGNLILGGTRGPNNSNLVGFLMKINLDGEIISSQDYNEITECGISLYDTSTIIMSGYKFPNIRPKLLLINTGGSILQNKTYFTPGYSSQNYIGRKLSDGNIVSVGMTTKLDLSNNNDGFIMKTDSIGNLIWYKKYRYTDGDYVEYFIDFIETSDGGMLVSGVAGESFENGGQNSWLIKLDEDGCLNYENCEVSIEDALFPDLLTIYPNPISDWLRIDLNNYTAEYIVQLYDSFGFLVLQEKFIKTGTYSLSVESLAKGIYYCRILSNGEVVAFDKVIKF